MDTIFKKNKLCEDIGEINYRHSKKAKYICVVISNTSKISVNIPDRHNIKDAIDFAYSKKNGSKKIK